MRCRTQFGHCVFLFLIKKFPFCDMRLEALVEIEHACNSVDDGNGDQE